MLKNKLLQLLKDKNVITQNNKRKFCWKNNFDDECKKYFDEFKVNYRSEEEAWFCLLNNIEPYRCEVCGDLAKFTGTKKTLHIGYNTTCEKCSANLSAIKLEKYHNKISLRTHEQRKEIVNKRKATNKEKYGDENYTLFGSKSFKQNLLEKYGDGHYSNHEKAKQTCLERYGVTCNLAIGDISKRSRENWKKHKNEILEKIKETSLLRYGCESPNQSEIKIGKIVESKKLKVLDIEAKYNCTQQRKLFKKYGQGWKVLGLEKLIINGRKFISNNDVLLIEQYYSTPHTNSFVSVKEKMLLDYIKSIYNGKILENTTNIVSSGGRYYELDIYLPDLKLAFEFNGTYWHSNLFKDKYYHQRKLLLAYNQGIQLIHIYENDWDNKNEEIKQSIRNIIEFENYDNTNWIKLQDFDKYTLSEPKCVYDDNGFQVYNEGTFIKK